MVDIGKAVGCQRDGPVRARLNRISARPFGLRRNLGVHGGCVVLRDERRAGLGYACLLERDAHMRIGGGTFAGGQQELFVIDAECSNAAHQRVGDHVGRIQPAAKADFENAGIGRRAGKGEESRRRGNFEEAGADCFALCHVQHFAQQFGQQVVGNQGSGDADAFVETAQVRAGEDVYGLACGLERGAQERAGRSLAVGSGNMEYRRQCGFGMAKVHAQVADDVEPQPPRRDRQSTQPFKLRLHRRSIRHREIVRARHGCACCPIWF